MKKSILFIALFFCFRSLDAQKLTIERFEKAHVDDKSGKVGILILSNGDTLQPGTYLKLGKGTLPNGDFNYIATASNTMQAKLHRSTTLQYLEIEKVKQKGDETFGFKYFIITIGGYLVQFEDAVATGEIIYK